MAIEFPSKVAALGLAQVTLGNINVRGCILIINSPGNYTIRLDRGVAMGWASFLYSLEAVASGSIIASQVSDTDFNIRVAGSPVDFDFSFGILPLMKPNRTKERR